MKNSANFVRYTCYTVLIFLLIIINSCSQPTQNTDSQIEIDTQITRRFASVDVAGPMPSKGWMTFQLMPRNEPRFPGTVAYTRFNWEDLEPSEGNYNWQLIDNALAAWKNKGKKFAFRIMTTNPSTKGYYCSPKWLFDNGCKGHEYVYRNDVTQPDSVTRIEVDYGDSLFLFYHEKFIKNLASRYDGNENIEFIDIGSYGLWGEWHTPNPAPLEIRKRIFDLYSKNFLKTKLIALSLDQEILKYAVENGIGLRRDGVGSKYDAMSWASPTSKYVELKLKAWENAPVVCEWYSNYNTLVSNTKCSIDTGLQFIYQNHATYILDNLGEITDSTVLKKLKTLGQDCGYNLILKEIAHHSVMTVNDTNLIAMKWGNNGIAPLYQNPNLIICFEKVYPDSGTVIQWHQQFPKVLPGDSTVIDIALPSTIGNGRYRIGITLQDSLTNATIPLPIKVPEHNGVYYISEVNIK